MAYGELIYTGGGSDIPSRGSTPPLPLPLPSAFNPFYGRFPDHTRWFSALFVLVSSTSQSWAESATVRQGNYRSTLSVIVHQLVDISDHLGLSLSSSNFKPTMSHYHSLVKIFPGCRVSVVGCLLSIVCVGYRSVFQLSGPSSKYSFYIQ
jgi:hypothetical protein